MNALITLLMVGLLTLSTEGYAAPPPIEEAPADVDGYIRCIQDSYASNRWQAGTIAGCRANNPAVRSLRDGDYVSVTSVALKVVSTSSHENSGSTLIRLCERSCCPESLTSYSKPQTH